ncbi:MAG: ABC transporter permease [Trueperaceae bacterium]
MILRFIGQRLLHMLLVMWMVATLVFLIFRILPGDPAQMILGLEPSRASLEALREQMGLNRPLYVQYFDWLTSAMRGDLGIAMTQGERPVTAMVIPALFRTLELAGLGIIIGLVVAVPVGIIAAQRSGTWVDQLARFSALAGFSLPSYWLGILLMLTFAYAWDILPAGGYSSIGDGLGKHIQYLILPTVTVGVVTAAILTRFMRAGMMEVLRLDYVRTARAKGLPERVVTYRHALRNALLPFVTVVGINFGALVGGMVVTEQVFAWPGLGWLIIQSINVRSYAVVQGAVLMTAAVFVLVNLIVDILYAFIDPRVSYQ